MYQYCTERKQFASRVSVATSQANQLGRPGTNLLESSKWNSASANSETIMVNIQATPTSGSLSSSRALMIAVSNPSDDIVDRMAMKVVNVPNSPMSAGVSRRVSSGVTASR